MLTKILFITALALGIVAADTITFGSYQKHKKLVDNDYLRLEGVYDHEWRWGTYYEASDDGAYHTESYYAETVAWTQVSVLATLFDSYNWIGQFWFEPFSIIPYKQTVSWHRIEDESVKDYNFMF